MRWWRVSASLMTPGSLSSLIACALSIQKVLRQRNDQKAALMLTEGREPRRLLHKSIHCGMGVAVRPASHMEVISLTPKARL